MHKSALIPAALGSLLVAAALGAAPAFAQPYGPDVTAQYSARPTETVTVIAPRFRAESAPLNGPMEKVSLSEPVTYTFHDLVTRRGAHALRQRVWETALDVCGRLADAYPVYTMTSAPPCVRTAYTDAMAKVNARITGARLAYYYGY